MALGFGRKARGLGLVARHDRLEVFAASRVLVGFCLFYL
jgi:hypothetical protein